MNNKKLIATLPRLNLPQLGIFAFALASVWSLFQMFHNAALHPTLLYWIPSALVEIVTAWLVFRVVESLRVVTDTKAAKRDKKFHAIIAGACVVLSLPTLIVSVVANRYEFQGEFGLALLFPASCVSCAVACAIPHVKAQRVAENDKALSDENKELRKRLRELEQSAAMIEAPDDAWSQYCASRNGDGVGTVPDCAKWYNDRGWYAPRDSTLRHRLKEL